MGAAVHRTWLNVRDAVNGREGRMVVSETERGEDAVFQNYQDVLNESERPTDLRAFVQAQDAMFKASHDLNHEMNTH
ncbi:PA2169 family four-helix-bundle protein [Deinococcus sp. KSM4-11]|uniref:PA2169 family four-helix-bundle protein n=1 Tax=Deinococcus sp. KSM4-11 TaxID=2568654 RepID=UPI001F0F4A69|nr:PA2169 family four-helix-bundle protein [Deinococcus sp. KSM4-11]